MRLLNFTLSDPDPSIVKQKNRPTGRSAFTVWRSAFGVRGKMRLLIGITNGIQEVCGSKHWRRCVMEGACSPTSGRLMNGERRTPTLFRFSCRLDHHPHDLGHFVFWFPSKSCLINRDRVLPLKADGLESGFRLEPQELMHRLLVDLLSRHFFGEHFTDHPGETCSPLGSLSRQKYVAYWP